MHKGIINIDKIVLYKPVLLKDLKNKIDWLLSRQEEINSNKPTTMMILWHQLLLLAIFSLKQVLIIKDKTM